MKNIFAIPLAGTFSVLLAFGCGDDALPIMDAGPGDDVGTDVAVLDANALDGDSPDVSRADSGPDGGDGGDSGIDGAVPPPEPEPEFNGWRWVQPAPTGNTLLAARSVDGTLFAAGTAGVIYRAVENDWTLLRGPDGRSVRAMDVGAAGFFAVGDDGLVVRIEGDGVTTEREDDDVNATSVFVAEDVWVAGRAGRLARRDAAGVWTDVDAGTTDDLLFVGGFDGDIVVGTASELRLRDGAGWNSVPLPSGLSAQAYLATDDTVWAATGGVPQRYDGSAWASFDLDCESRCPSALFEGDGARPVLALIGSGFSERVTAYGADGSRIEPLLNPLGGRALTIHNGEVTSVGLAGLTEHESDGRFVYRGLGANNLYATSGVAVDGSRAFLLGASFDSEWPLFEFNGTWTESTISVRELNPSATALRSFTLFDGTLTVDAGGIAAQRNADGSWAPIAALAEVEVLWMDASSGPLFVMTRDGEVARLSSAGVVDRFDVRSSYNFDDRIHAGTTVAYVATGSFRGTTIVRVEVDGSVTTFEDVLPAETFELGATDGDDLWLVAEDGGIHQLAGMTHTALPPLPLIEGEIPSALTVSDALLVATSHGRIMSWDGSSWELENTASGVAINHLAANENLALAGSGAGWGMMLKRLDP